MLTVLLPRRGRSLIFQVGTEARVSITQGPIVNAITGAARSGRFVGGEQREGVKSEIGQSSVS